MSTAEPGPRQLTFAEAVREALAEEMRRDSRVCIIGEDVAEAGTPFKVLSGLVEEFGTERVIDTPISEAGFTGLAVGAAMTGMRPVVDIMFGDFLTLTLDQLVNQAAKIHYMSGGELHVPMVLRTTLGATRRTAAQHSQSLHAWVSHVPGLKVVLPSTPFDAKGLLKAAIRDDDPVIYLEHKFLYRRIKEDVPDGEVVTPIGRARVARVGRHVSVITYAAMLHVALEAAEAAARDGIDVEVVDLRTLLPLDEEAILRTAAKTGKVIVLHEATRTGGPGGEIAALVAEHAFEYLDAPVVRLAPPDTPVPYSPPLEEDFLPNARKVGLAIRALADY